MPVYISEREEEREGRGRRTMDMHIHEPREYRQVPQVQHLDSLRLILLGEMTEENSVVRLDVQDNPILRRHRDDLVGDELAGDGVEDSIRVELRDLHPHPGSAWRSR